MEKDNLFKRLDIVMHYIDNCDNKAGLLLAVLSVFVPIMFTSDFFISKIDSLIKPIITYITVGVGYFDLYNCICIVTIVLSVFSVIISIYFLLEVIIGRCDYSKFKQKELVNTSNLYFGEIATKQYSQYKAQMNNCSICEIDDILSQIYISSIICSGKFANYNKSIKAAKFAIFTTIISFFLLLFV